MINSLIETLKTFLIVCYIADGVLLVTFIYWIQDYIRNIDYYENGHRPYFFQQKIEENKNDLKRKLKEIK